MRDFGITYSGSQQLSKNQIQNIVKHYVHEALDQDEIDRIQGKIISRSQLDDNIDTYEYLLSEFRESLALRDIRSVEGWVKGILKKRNLKIDEGSLEYRKLCREVLKAQIVALERLIKRELGDYSDEIESQPTREIVKEPPGIPLTQLIDDYFNENLRAGKWSPRTIKEYKNSFRVLKEFLGADIPVNLINHQKMQDYKKLLLKLPANVFKTKKYEGVSLHDILKLDIKGNLSVSAINRYLMNAQAAFRYGVRNGHMKMNPAEGLQLPKQKRPQEERQAFDSDDLNKIFHSEHYHQDTFIQPYMFWLPPLGLYTGCRIEELCQLHCSDIHEQDGIWCLDINDEGDSKRLKNAPSKRIVPLHPVLVDLNFPGYVEMLRAKGEVRVFPELRKISHQYSHAASKWFARYKKQVGLEGKRKTYHSFRHTFTDHLKQKFISRTLIDELTGHAVQGESFGRYGKRYFAENLYTEGILKIEFDIDLNHLKKSKWTTA